MTLLNQTMDVEQVVISQEDTGAVTRTFAVIASEVACRIQPILSHRAVEFARPDLRPTHRVYFLEPIELDERHRLVLSVGGSFDVVAVERATEAGRPHVAIVRAVMEP